MSDHVELAGGAADGVNVPVELPSCSLALKDSDGRAPVRGGGGLGGKGIKIMSCIPSLIVIVAL